ncbi:MAG TPA: hypothetical protein VFB15_11670 [Candidatus Binataceae bacterium]|nr:hypothetical protein [Candidatus Binataceae bacterium]
MRNLIRLGLLGLVAIGLVSTFGCATTSNPEMQLVGNVVNPMASVLAYEGQTCGDSDAILNYNTILNACQQGLPIQGVVGSAFLTRFCQINGYSGVTPALAMLTWQPVANPPAACASSPNIAANRK